MEGQAPPTPEAPVRRAVPGEVTDGLNAYYLDVVDATQVATVMSEREEEEENRRRQRFYLMVGACTCLVIALAIIIPLVVLANSQPAAIQVVLGTPAPSASPSLAPSEASTLEPTSDDLAAAIQFIRQQENNTVWGTEDWTNDRSSAPFQAAKWVVEEGKHSNLKLLQRYALATFYFATNWNQSWINCSPTAGGCPTGKKPWLSSSAECNWGFVTCDNSSRVTELNFPTRGNGLSGTLPPQLSLLSLLRLFSIANNKVRGGNNRLTNDQDNDILTTTANNNNDFHLHAVDQAFYGLSSLQVLVLYNNQFTGSSPTRIWPTNPVLHEILLDENSFVGTLPDELWAATSCRQLQLNGNFITGTIPTSLGLLNSSLKILELEENRLRGSIPSELFALTELTELALSNNTELTGNMNADDGFAQLSNLQTFQASFTQLQGTLPGHMFASWTNLQVWKVQNATLSGTLSEDLALWNASLRRLWLLYNQFTGPLPSALDVLTALEELRVEGNDFTGTISDALCARRGDGFQALTVLTVDCSVECTCCDSYDDKCG